MNSTHEFVERDAALLATLTSEQRYAVVNTFSSHALEGFDPTSEHVAIAVSFARGDISGDAYVAQMAAVDAARQSCS